MEVMKPRRSESSEQPSEDKYYNVFVARSDIK